MRDEKTYLETKEPWGQEQATQFKVPEATAGKYFWNWTGINPFDYLKRAQPLSYVPSLYPNATENLVNLSSAVLGERGHAALMLGGSSIVNPRLIPVLMNLGQEYWNYTKNQEKSGPRWVQTTLLPSARRVSELESQRLKLEKEHKRLKEIVQQLSIRVEELQQQLATPMDAQLTKRLEEERVAAVKKHELWVDTLKRVEAQLAETNVELRAAQEDAQKQFEQVDLQTFQLAEKICKTLLVENPSNFGNLDQSSIQKAVDAAWENPAVRDSFINKDKVLFLVASRLAILDSDNKLSDSDTTKRVAYLVPVNKEFKRLKPISECITGENFLENKCKQLEWLYRDCKQLSWKIHLYDDQAPHGKEDEKITSENQSKTRVALDASGKIRPCIRRTIDAADELLAPEGRLAKYRNKVLCFGYEDLVPQIQSYKDPELAKMDADTLANTSVKAGAVHLGLRHIAGIEYSAVCSSHRLADVVLMTDADTSVDLATTGTLLQEHVVKNEQFVIGARRGVLNAVVGNKAGDRHLMSLMFNLLGRVLLNIQVPDTQVGNKLLDVDCIEQVSKGMHNLTMAFDTELIRLIQDAGIRPTSIPGLWIDSPEESQSSTQAGNMARGVVDIFMHLHQVSGKMANISFSTTTPLHTVYDKLAHDDKAQAALQKVLQLATNEQFTTLIKYSENLYAAVTPFIFRAFVNSFKLFLQNLAEGKVDQNNLKQLLTDIQTIYTNTTQSHALGFMLEKFPEIFSIVELLCHDPEYARVIAPLFLGNSMLSRGISASQLPAFNEFISEQALFTTRPVPASFLMQQLGAWSNLPAHNESSLPAKPPREPYQNKDREAEGWSRVAALSQESKDDTPKEPKIISLVMQFDQSAPLEGGKVREAQLDYYKRVIAGKIEALRQEVDRPGMEHIKINLIVVDARSSKEKAKDPKNLTKNGIESIITEANKMPTKAAPDYPLFDALGGAFYTEVPPSRSLNNVACQFKDLEIIAEDPPGKAVVVRAAMRQALKEVPSPTAVGFIDFSPKIPIGEMGHLIADVLETDDEGRPIVSIGTRRHEESEVFGKKKEFLFRSTALNQLVKAFFPELAHLSDTQTGFKLFDAVLLSKVLGTDDAALKSNTFAFDIELLARAQMYGGRITERPIPFNDTTESMEASLGPADSMFPDLLRISAHSQRFMRKIQRANASVEHPQFFANGAEHTVYDIGNNYLLKIESQHVNPNFRLLLQHIAFNRVRAPAADTTAEGGDLFIMQFNTLLRSRTLERYLHLLRDNPELNRQVLGIISAWEDKQKSIDLGEVLRRGKGLVGPFSYIDLPFSTRLEGMVYNFDASHRSKISQRAIKIVQDDFVSILEVIKTKHDEEALANVIKNLNEMVIDKAIGLFNAMWRRGLFDLDTNIISDLGYFLGEEGTEQLMSLDPGEIITGIMNVDVERALALLDKRSDILLMNAHINGLVNELGLPEEEAQKIKKKISDEVLGHYKTKMIDFFNNIKKEKELVKGLLDAKPGMTEKEACAQLPGLTYEAQWQSQDQSQFVMDKIELPFPAIREDVPIYHSDNTSKLLAAGYNEPYRKTKLLPPTTMVDASIPSSSTEQKLPAHAKGSSVTLVVPLGKEEVIRSPLSLTQKGTTHLQAVPKGSIVPFCDLIKDNITIQSPMTEGLGSASPSSPNAAFVLDAGGGTRTATVGLSAGSKGNIMLSGRSLNDYAISTASTIADGLKAKNIDAVVLSSCDDYFSDNPEHMAAFINNLAAYFGKNRETKSNPGLYWSDLPNSGKEYMPLTVQDTYKFVTSDFMREEVRNFLRSMLVTRGYAQQDIVKNSFQILDQMHQAFLAWLKENSEKAEQKKDPGSEHGGMSFSSVLSMGNIMSEFNERYAKLIQFHAMQQKKEISGLKRPFLMVMSKEFFKDFRDLVEKHHDALSSAQETLTWESFLLRGLKADTIMWNAFKPKEISAGIWGELYGEIQTLKRKHHIDLTDALQEAQRATPPVWHNLDDPYALLQVSKEMFANQANCVLKKAEEKGRGQVQIISDHPFSDENARPVLSSKNDCSVNIIAVGCSLGRATIEPNYIENVLVTHHHIEEILMYQIALDPAMTLQLTMGHVHTQHLERIYSTPIGPFTKEILKNQPVYVYEPHPNDPKLLIAKPLLQTVLGVQKQVRMGDFANYIASLTSPAPTLSAVESKEEPHLTPAAPTPITLPAEQKEASNNEAIISALTTAIEYIQQNPNIQINKTVLSGIKEQLINTACSDEMLSEISKLRAELVTAKSSPITKKGAAFFDHNRESTQRREASPAPRNEAMASAINDLERALDAVEDAMSTNLGRVVIDTNL